MKKSRKTDLHFSVFQTNLYGYQMEQTYGYYGEFFFETMSRKFFFNTNFLQKCFYKMFLLK